MGCPFSCVTNYGNLEEGVGKRGLEYGRTQGCQMFSLSLKPGALFFFFYILPPTTVVTDYAIGLKQQQQKLSANGQFFAGAQIAASL